MEVPVLDPKRAQMIELLREWTMRATSNLRGISSLHASLESLTRYIKWARANPAEHLQSRMYAALLWSSTGT
jgi:hypothetical protein